MLSLQEGLYTVEPFQSGIDDPVDLALIHLGIRSWQVRVGQNSFTDILESQADIGGLEDYYLKPGGNFFITKDALREPVGLVGLRNDGDRVGTVKRLGVVPEHLGHQIGLAMMGSLIDWCKSKRLWAPQLNNWHWRNGSWKGLWTAWF